MKLSLTVQTGIIISSLVTVLICGFGTYEYTSQARAWKGQLQRKADLAMSRLVRSAENALWAMDASQLEAVLCAEMQDSEIESIVVKEGTDGALKLTKAMHRDGDGKPAPATSEPAPSAISLSQPVLHDKTQLGVAVLNFSDAGLRAQSRSLLINKIAEILILNVGLAVCVLLVMRYRLVRPINRIITGLQGNAATLSETVAVVSRNSQTLAESSSEQAASLEETSSSLEEMSSMTKRNAENSATANQCMQQEVGPNFARIQERLSRMDQAMQQTLAASRETAKIIKTIDEIAFQTNLLALNAAVEAARAGEAGMGFAVVADEVRSLAARSAEAAKNTQNLLENSTTRLQETATHFQEVSAAMTENAQLGKKVSELVAEISSASREQAEGIQQINTAVSQMDRVTQGNAANAEESASAAQVLNGQAQSMNEAVSALLALVGGQVAAGTTQPTGNLSGAELAHAPHPNTRPPKRASSENSHASRTLLTLGGNGRHELQPMPIQNGGDIPMPQAGGFKDF
ncbi:MAG TPA: methyl-accepting chemotaxis protein [Verrucomicrobiae bacterium]